MNDIKFQKDGFKFNYRVAVLFTFKDRALIQKAEDDAYFSLLGGRVKFGETTNEAIVREIEEEIGKSVNEQDLSLSRVCENFFEYNGIRFHELLYIYIIELNENDELTKLSFVECRDKENVKMIWESKDNILKLDLRPTIAKKILFDTGLKHIIIK